MDWNTLPQELVVQHDRVVSIEEIGSRRTYNITVEGEHNYFLGDSLENLTLTANSGMTENYSQILETGADQLGKNAEALTAAERAQAKFLGIQQLSAAQAGNYALYLDTDAAAQDRLNYSIEESQRLLGTALMPALSNVQQGFGSLIQSLGITDANMHTVQASFVTLSSVAQMAGAILVGVAQTAVGAVQSVGSLSLKPLENALSASGDRMVDVSVRWQESINKVATGSADTMIEESKRGAAGVADGTAKATREMLKSIDEANHQFSRSQEQRLEQFQQSLTDMIMSHRDKSLSIKADLTAEDAAYAQSAKNREKDYQDEIATLEERHADTVKDITEQISEERESGLMVDGVLYREANQEKIADLEENLREETTKHKEALAKRRAEYQADVSEDKVRHDEKRTQLETELATELEILNTHRTDVAAVGDAQKEDDITRLKNQYAQASAEATRNHQEQLVKIRERGAEQGSTFGNNFAAGSQPGIDRTKAHVENLFNQVKTSASTKGKDAGTHWWTSFKDTLSSWFSGFPTLISEWINNGASSIKAKTQHQFTGPMGGVGNLFSNAIDWITKREGGGPVSAGTPYMVGEREPELFVPNQSGQILNQKQIGAALGSQAGGRTNSITIGTVINQSNMDPDAFFRSIAWELR